MLLGAAADLFAARGYHAVGIDDIGSAAGISGPGVYRHFSSKQALLESLCDRAMTRMLSGAQDLSSSRDALGGLVDLHVAFAVGERALSDDVRRSLRQRQRSYEQVWREVVAPLRADLSPAEVSVAVTSTLALLNSTALVETTVPARRLATLLRRMALSALLSRRTPSHRA